MAFRDDVLTVLTGGLGGLVDSGTGTRAPVETIPVEEVEPEPQLQDREPFLLRGVSQQQVVFGGALLLGVIALVLVARAL